MKILSSNHAQHVLGYHIVFCPKYRHQVLSGSVEVELKHILTEDCMTYDWKLYALEVMPDHIHIFVQVDHTAAPVEIAKKMKYIIAVYIFTKFLDLKQRKFWGSLFVEQRNLLFLRWRRVRRSDSRAILRLKKTELNCWQHILM